MTAVRVFSPEIRSNLTKLDSKLARLKDVPSSWRAMSGGK
jgi:hypothetical protein